MVGRRAIAAGPMLAAAAAAAMLICGAASGVAAQALTDPHPAAKWSPRTLAKPRANAQAKNPCTGFGAGFVNVPGTDACVKVGGWVTMEGGTAGR